MLQQTKAWAREWLPPIVIRALSRLRPSSVSWHGDFPTWAEAVAASSGYDQPRILDKVKSATLAVKSGEAAYERDSVVFAEASHSWPLVSCLMWVAARRSGRLRVLDLGGSLGSSYFQNRVWLEGLADVSWGIVEQPHFVACGKLCCETDQLRFFETIRECADAVEPNVVLLSSVLPYLDNPLDTISAVCALAPDAVLVDRTGFVPPGQPERISVQTVTEPIYDASYPCRFFSERDLVERFHRAGFVLARSWPALDRADVPSHYKGLLFIREG